MNNRKIIDHNFYGVRQHIHLREFVGVRKKGDPNYGLVGLTVSSGVGTRKPMSGEISVRFQMAGNVWYAIYVDADLVSIHSLGHLVFKRVIEDEE